MPASDGEIGCYFELLWLVLLSRFIIADISGDFLFELLNTPAAIGALMLDRRFKPSS